MPTMKAFAYSVFNKIRRDFLLFVFRLRNPNADAQSVFDYYFRHNLFGDAESLSGTGSSVTATATIRAALAEIIAELEPSTLLDVPCGDFNWAKEIDFRGCKYVGADIVEGLIEQNQAQYGRDDRTFLVLDILKDAIPEADLILCRDLLIHFPNDDVVKALTAMKRSGATYLLTTTFSGEKKNRDIPLGSFRPLNLTLPPFSLPAPMKTIPDEDYVKFRGKALCLWRISDLPASFD